MKRAAFLLTAIMDQQRWIDEHGSTLAGYIARYGSADDQRRYGNGGEAIYEADTAALDEWKRKYNQAVQAAKRRKVAR